MRNNVKGIRLARPEDVEYSPNGYFINKRGIGANRWFTPAEYFQMEDFFIKFHRSAFGNNPHFLDANLVEFQKFLERINVGGWVTLTGHRAKQHTTVTDATARAILARLISNPNPVLIGAFGVGGICRGRCAPVAAYKNNYDLRLQNSKSTRRALNHDQIVRAIHELERN